MAKIALGTWAWGAGAFGGDAVFGSKTDVENLKPVFDAAMKAGLNLWDTATAYGMGESERILGTLARQYERKDVEISTKFTPQIAEVFENSVEKMALASMERMGIDDIYSDPALTAIAERHGKTARQVTLRFMLQMGVVLIPKTTSRDRLRENIDIFDFELSAGEMRTLASMDKGQPMIGNPQNPALVEMSAGW